MTEEIDQEEALIEAELRQRALEDLFHETVSSFKLRWMNKKPPTYISQQGLYNYAMSIMKYEFQKAFDKETSERLVEFYKP